MKSPELLFIQRRPKRAGAQTSLYRLATISPYKSIVLCSESGWLTTAYSNTLIAKWPSPRSLTGRLYGLKRASKKIITQVQPSIVIANDHQECPLALEIAREAGIPCLGILRTPGMNQRDFKKYQCSSCDHLFTVGAELSKRVCQWASTATTLFQEGFLENEFANEHVASDSFPEEILIAGSSEPRKGFSDLLAAIQILESRHPDLPIKKITLTGEPPSGSLPDLRCELSFVGRVNDFIGFAKNFHFAVHPSRSETFGLAPLELIIAGIPTLSTRTGVTTDRLLPESWLADPSSPKSLALALEGWINHWEAQVSHQPSISEFIKKRFHVNNTSAEFFSTVDDIYGRITG